MDISNKINFMVMVYIVLYNQKYKSLKEYFKMDIIDQVHIWNKHKIVFINIMAVI